MPYIDVQRGTADIGNSGGTAAPGTAFGSLASTIVWNTNNRFQHAGPSGSTSDQEADDMSGAVELTGTNQITFHRASGSATDTMRFAWESWEYTGPAGGPDEFIVRDRVSLTLNGASFAQQSVAGISDDANVIPIITGIVTDVATDGADSSTAMSWIDSGFVNVDRGGTAGIVTVYVTVVEFTGSNWLLRHGYSPTGADSGSIGLITASVGAGPAGTVPDWARALIHAGTNANNANGTDDSISDLWPRYTPGTDSGGQSFVDFAFDADHVDSTGDGEHLLHVLYHPRMSVTRIQNTGAGSGANNVSVTSANLSSLDTSSVIVTGTTSGTDTTYGRGWVNARLTSTTNVELFRHRAWNTTNTELQVIDITGIGPEVAGTAAAVSSGAGDITVESGGAALQGTAAAVSATTGDLSRAIEVTATAAVVTDASGDLTRTMELDATAEAVATSAGDLTRDMELGATAAVTSSTAGALTRTRELDATAPAASSTSGDLTRSMEIGATAAPVSSTSGDLTRTMEVDGTAAAVSTGAGALDGGGDLRGTAVVVSSATGELARSVETAGAAPAVSTGTGTLERLIESTGSAASVSTTAGQLLRAREVAGSAAAVVSASGTLSSAAISLQGTAATVSGASGAMLRSRSIIGTSTMTAGGVSDLSRTFTMGGTAVGSSVTAGLTTLIVPLTIQALPNSGTFRGGSLIVATSADLLDTSRDASLTSLPTGWTTSGDVDLNQRAGALLRSVTTPATLTSANSDYVYFDAAVDVLPLTPPDSAPDIAKIACIEHEVGGIVVSVCLVRGAFSDPTQLLAIGESFAGDPTGGVVVAPSGTVTLRLVRNANRVYGFIGTREATVDNYTSLTTVLDTPAPDLGTTTGPIRLASRTGSSNRVTSAEFLNFTVRSHASINGRLFEDKRVPTNRQIVGNIPAAPLDEVGLASVSVFGLFGVNTEDTVFQYTLPAPRTVSNEIVRTLRTYQDAQVRDPNT